MNLATFSLSHRAFADLVIALRRRGLIPVCRGKEGDCRKIPWIRDCHVRTGRTLWVMRPDHRGGRNRKIRMHDNIPGTSRRIIRGHVNHKCIQMHHSEIQAFGRRAE